MKTTTRTKSVRPVQVAPNSRRYLIAANWKMALTTAAAESLAESLAAVRRLPKSCDLVVCPGFPALEVVGRVLRKSKIMLGAQDVFWQRAGAFTGEVSALDLRELGCRYVIVGHSERRQLLHETDEMVARKVFASLASGLSPILCVGETGDQHRQGLSHHVVTQQLQAALRHVPPLKGGQELVVAYEPVWAIGSGRPASVEDARQMSGVIRQSLTDALGGRIAARSTRVLYGGSVSPENVREYLEYGEMDGVLLGGVSQHAVTFEALLRALLAG